jgi:RNA polymerase II-associated factor 1
VQERELLATTNNPNNMSAATNNTKPHSKAKADKHSSQTNNAASSTPAAPSSEFICKFRYLNRLPEIPFDPKFLAYPFDELRFARYATTSLEKNYKFQLHTEFDMGIPIDLIEPNAYKPIATPVNVLGDAGEALTVGSGAGSQKRRFETLRPAVPWLRRTEYISADSELPKFRSDKIETK